MKTVNEDYEDFLRMGGFNAVLGDGGVSNERAKIAVIKRGLLRLIYGNERKCIVCVCGEGKKERKRYFL